MGYKQERLSENQGQSLRKNDSQKIKPTWNLPDNFRLYK